jgi:hypothetical protein
MIALTEAEKLSDRRAVVQATHDAGRAFHRLSRIDWRPYGDDPRIESLRTALATHLLKADVAAQRILDILRVD